MATTNEVVDVQQPDEHRVTYVSKHLALAGGALEDTDNNMISPQPESSIQQSTTQANANVGEDGQSSSLKPMNSVLVPVVSTSNSSQVFVPPNSPLENEKLQMNGWMSFLCQRWSEDSARMYQATQAQLELTKNQQELWARQQKETEEQRKFTAQLLTSYKEETSKNSKITAQLLEEYQQDRKNQQDLTKECLQTLKKFASRLEDHNSEQKHQEKEAKNNAPKRPAAIRKMPNHEWSFYVQFKKILLEGLSSEEWDWCILPLYLQNSSWAIVVYFQAFKARYKNSIHGTNAACGVEDVRGFLEKWKDQSKDLKTRVADYDTGNRFFPNKRLGKLTLKARNLNAATLTKQASESMYFLSPDLVEQVLQKCKNTKLGKKSNWEPKCLKSANAGPECKNVMESEYVAWELFSKKFAPYIKPDSGKWTIYREKAMEPFWKQAPEKDDDDDDDEDGNQTEEEKETSAPVVSMKIPENKKRKPRKQMGGKQPKIPRGKAPFNEFKRV
jgi:hypothetical protein